jgi:ABC-type dipeptide/oligopeptide/nickel transport system permease component
MRQLLTRAALSVSVVWPVFLLIHLVPGDPILQMLGKGATPADIEGQRGEPAVLNAEGAGAFRPLNAAA